jgi:hypothetical protein
MQMNDYISTFNGHLPVIAKDAFVGISTFCLKSFVEDIKGGKAPCSPLTFTLGGIENERNP